MTGITFEAATDVVVLAAEGDANVTFAMQSLDKAAPGLGVTLPVLSCYQRNNITVPDLAGAPITGVRVRCGKLDKEGEDD